MTNIVQKTNFISSDKLIFSESSPTRKSVWEGGQSLPVVLRHCCLVQSLLPQPVERSGRENTQWKIIRYLINILFTSFVALLCLVWLYTELSSSDSWRFLFVIFSRISICFSLSIRRSFISLSLSVISPSISSFIFREIPILDISSMNCFLSRTSSSTLWN